MKNLVRLIYDLLRLVFFAFALQAQTAPAPGTVTDVASHTVTAIAGTAGATGTLTCVFTTPAFPTVHTVCTAIGSSDTLVQDSTPSVAATNGAVGSLTVAGNNVTWIIQQPAAGSVTYQIAANGTMKTGNF